MKYPENLDQWIVSYLQDSLMDEDKAGLETWLEECPAHRELFERLIKEENWKQGVARIASFDNEKAWQIVLKKSGQRTNTWKRWVGIAAGIILIIGFGCLVYNKKEEMHQMSVVDNRENKVQLNVASGQSFALDSVRNIEIDQMILKNDGKQLIVGLIGQNSERVGWNTVEVPRGTDYSLVLTDGTEIFLNAETVLRFPDRFEEGKKREVWIDGEAYFRVSKDETRPFVVHTGEIEVTVLGTVFNVMAYENAAEQQITLISGKVEVGCAETANQVILEPGLQAIYNKIGKTIVKKEVDVSYYTAWHEGLFAFRERPLVEVMEILTRWYDFEVFFQNPRVRNVVYTGKVERHATLREVLEHFRQMGEFDFEIRNRIVIIK